MAYETIIFDLDGTLLDTMDDLCDSCNHSLAFAGLPQRTREEMRCFIGHGVVRLMEQTVPNGRENPAFETALSEMRTWYRTHNRIKTAPYEGIDWLLKTLFERGYELAVVSNKPDSSVKPLVKAYFGDFISVAIGERPTLRCKPAPDTVLQALQELGKDLSTAVYVGDSEVDTATARNAGMDCISVTWGFRTRAELQQAGATMYADHPSEILRYL